MCRSYDSSIPDECDSVPSGGDSESDNDQNSDVDVCSCIESQTDSPSLHETRSLDGDDLYTVHVGVDNANTLCVKLNDLIRKGKIPKERIL